MTDPFQLLIDDHNRVRQLYSQFENTRSFDEKRRIMNDIIREIAIHSSVEERVIYPLIQKWMPKGQYLYETATTDHQVVKEILYGFDKNSNTDWEQINTDLFVKNAKKFFNNLSEHLAEEETIIFPSLRNLLPKEKFNNLSTDILNAKSDAPTHIYPSAPSGGLAAKIVHPITGFVDTVKDTITGRP